MPRRVPDPRKPAPLEIKPVRRSATEHIPEAIARAILDVVGDVPSSREPGPDTSGPEPSMPDARDVRARAVIDAAARRSGLVAGSLALPPGPLGWMTVLPELIAIWKIQAQMVADVSAVYGQHWQLSREQMLFCLFRHTSAQVFRDFAIRAGQRWLVQQTTQRVLQTAARQVGVTLSKRAISRGVSRWVPLIGAIGVGAYAWYDTREVGGTAVALFAPPPADGRRIGAGAVDALAVDGAAAGPAELRGDLP